MTVLNSIREQSILVDASAFYAALDRSDQWHSEAVRGFRQLTNEARRVCTTNLVVAEVFALAMPRLGPQLAMRWLDATASIQIIFQRESHHPNVQALLRRHTDSGFSYGNVFSFVVMQELGLRTAFTFDHHFSQYGWDVFPR